MPTRRAGRGAVGALSEFRSVSSRSRVVSQIGLLDQFVTIGRRGQSRRTAQAPRAPRAPQRSLRPAAGPASRIARSSRGPDRVRARPPSQGAAVASLAIVRSPMLSINFRLAAGPGGETEHRPEADGELGHRGALSAPLDPCAPEPFSVGRRSPRSQL